jgi:hypothetical protein
MGLRLTPHDPPKPYATRAVTFASLVGLPAFLPARPTCALAPVSPGKGAGGCNGWVHPECQAGELDASRPDAGVEGKYVCRACRAVLGEVEAQRSLDMTPSERILRIYRAWPPLAQAVLDHRREGVPLLPGTPCGPVTEGPYVGAIGWARWRHWSGTGPGA